MNNIALLIGDFVLYWNQIICCLGILAGVLLVFAMRPYTRIKRKALLSWFIPAVIFSFLFSKLFYYYCNQEQFISLGNALAGIFDHHYSAMGVLLGTILAAWIIKRLHLVKWTGNLLDTAFPGVILMLAVIRLSYLFGSTFHSTLHVGSAIWQRLPFAVPSTDAAGNQSFVFAPFFISFLLLLGIVLVSVLYLRNKVRNPGNLFHLIFTFFMLSEIVLESTRYDSPKLHFILLRFLNPYVSFISFSMVFCGICLIIIFIQNFRKVQKKISRNTAWISIAAFAAGMIFFGVCEYLLQRYTTQAVLFHWLQVFFAVWMGTGIGIVIMLQTGSHPRKSYFSIIGSQ